jgi:hypothetical protein
MGLLLLHFVLGFSRLSGNSDLSRLSGLSDLSGLSGFNFIFHGLGRFNSDIGLSLTG